MNLLKKHTIRFTDKEQYYSFRQLIDIVVHGIEKISPDDLLQTTVLTEFYDRALGKSYDSKESIILSCSEAQVLNNLFQSLIDISENSYIQTMISLWYADINKFLVDNTDTILTSHNRGLLENA